MIDIKQTALRDSFRGLIDMGLLHADRHDVGSGVFSSDGGAFGRPASQRGLRAGAVVCAVRGVGLDAVAEMAKRVGGGGARLPVAEAEGMGRALVVTGHAVGENTIWQAVTKPPEQHNQPQSETHPAVQSTSTAEM